MMSAAIRRRLHGAATPSYDLATVANKTLLLTPPASGKTISGGFLDAWNDQSGGARNVTSTTTARPADQSPGVDGENTVLFDGVNDLLTSAVTVTNFVTASAWCLYAFARWRTVATLNGTANIWTHDCLVGDAGATAFAITAQRAATYGTDQAIIIQGYHWDGGIKPVSVNAFANTWYLIRARLSGGTFGLRVGKAGVEATIASGNTSAGGLGQVLRIGRGNGASAFGNVEIKWLLIKNAAFDPTEDTGIISISGSSA